MDIVLYSTDHCASCKEAIRFFHEKGAPFRHVDVGTDKANFTEMLLRGGIATPYILIGEQAFHSFDRLKIQEVMNNG